MNETTKTNEQGRWTLDGEPVDPAVLFDLGEIDFVVWNALSIMQPGDEVDVSPGGAFAPAILRRECCSAAKRRGVRLQVGLLWSCQHAGHRTAIALAPGFDAASGSHRISRSEQSGRRRTSPGRPHP